MDFMQLMQALGLMGGAGGGGGVGGGTTPGFGGGGGVPYGTPSAGVPTMGLPAAPEDVSPMPVPPPSSPGLRMPTMNDVTSAFSRSPPQPSPMMSGTGGVPFAEPSQMSLGAALEPQPPVPAPTGTPMPMSRPPGLGLGTAGGTGPGSPGNYGGSPATNPNLKPIGEPPAAAQRPDLAKMLQGIKQPQGPDVVKPSTPAAHQTKAVGPSDLMALLASLGMGGQRGLRMPTTLGQALELKPSSWGGMYG